MQAKSGCVFDGSAHLKNIPTNSSGEGIYNNNPLYLKRVAPNSYKTSNLVVLSKNYSKNMIPYIQSLSTK